MTVEMKKRRSTGASAYGCPVQVLYPKPKPGDIFIHPADQSRYLVARDGSWRKVWDAE